MVPFSFLQQQHDDICSISGYSNQNCVIYPPDVLQSALLELGRTSPATSLRCFESNIKASRGFHKGYGDDRYASRCLFAQKTPKIVSKLLKMSTKLMSI